MSMTFILDVDGTLIQNWNEGMSFQLTEDVQLLPGVIQFLDSLHAAGHRIVLTTARPESNRETLSNQLESSGIFWDHLIMGLPKGPRVVINDFKLGEKRAMAYGIRRQRNMEWDKDTLSQIEGSINDEA